MVSRVLVLALLVVLSAACGRKTGVSRAPAVHKGMVQEGLASWYGHGDGYHGKRTASGERFDKNKLTAAHFDFPFGTRVEVRNLRNNRRVVVRINDRLPLETLRKGRIIDLSYGTARRLDMVQAGVVPVRLRVVETPSRRAALQGSRAGATLGIEPLARKQLPGRSFCAIFRRSWLSPLWPQADLFEPPERSSTAICNGSV